MNDLAESLCTIKKECPALLGRIVKAERKKRCLSATNFAQKLGVSKSCVCKWEKSKRIPTKFNIECIAILLGTHLVRETLFREGCDTRTLAGILRRI